MKLPHPFVQLPLLFDADRLAAEIDALGEGPWMPHPQGFAGNSMLPLVAVAGDPANESFAGTMLPTPHLARCPYLQQAIAALGVVVGRTRLMRLSGHAEVTRHADQGYYWADRVRVHVPIVTQPTVRFECEDQHVNMAAGECWIFDTWRQHRVLNDDTRSRIHLVVDTVGGDPFWALVEAGRRHDGQPLGPSWQPRLVAPLSVSTPALPLESSNVPVVMSPWELEARLRFLHAEAVPHPALPAFEARAERLVRQWRMAWAQWGDQAAGWPAYRALMDGFVRDAQTMLGLAVLRNELGMVSALVSLVQKVAVTGRAPASAPAAAPRPVAAAAAATMSAWGAPMANVRWGMPANVAPARAAVRPGPGPQAPVSDPVFDRPVFIVSSPRSGSTMLFEAMASAPGVYTIGGESHALIESVPALNPASRGFDSNCLRADLATPDVAGPLRQRFLAALRDRDGRPASSGRLRMLEKTPKNSLRVDFLARVFPESLFIYLYRDPREVLGSMIDAWNSGRFRTYPQLPGWTGPPWSLLLVPGWRELAGKPLADIVASQWESTTRLLLDDLQALPAERRCSVRYDQLVADPQGELTRLCARVGLGWDRRVEGALPLARYTLTQPRAEKWRQHEAEIGPRLAQLQATAERAATFAADPS